MQPTNTETEMSSFWWNYHHWLHWKLSKWQLPVQSVMKISSKWRHFCFSEGLWMSKSVRWCKWMNQGLPCLRQKLPLRLDTDRAPFRYRGHYSGIGIPIIQNTIQIQVQQGEAFTEIITNQCSHFNISMTVMHQFVKCVMVAIVFFIS